MPNRRECEITVPGVSGAADRGEEKRISLNSFPHPPSRRFLCFEAHMDSLVPPPVVP